VGYWQFFPHIAESTKTMNEMSFQQNLTYAELLEKSKLPVYQKELEKIEKYHTHVAFCGLQTIFPSISMIILNGSQSLHFHVAVSPSRIGTKN
jgi:oligoendopeptidase F